MSASPVLLERRGAVAVVTLNRPEAMNALSQSLRRALCAAIQELQDDPGIEVCILTGAGEKAFCAGLDLKEIRAKAELLADATGSSKDENPSVCLRSFTKPVVAAVNGVAITGGFELMMDCDVVIAADGARFADTHAKVGLIPAWGLSQKLARLIGPYRAKELTLTGRFLGADEAVDWGLVNRVVPATDLIDHSIRLANEMAALGGNMLQRHKQLIDAGYALALREGLALEAKAAAGHNVP